MKAEEKLIKFLSIIGVSLTLNALNLLYVFEVVILLFKLLLAAVEFLCSSLFIDYLTRVLCYFMILGV